LSPAASRRLVVPPPPPGTRPRGTPDAQTWWLPGRRRSLGRPLRSGPHTVASGNLLGTADLAMPPTQEAEAQLASACSVGHGNHGTRKQIPCTETATETHGNHGKNRNSPKTPPKGRDQRPNSPLAWGARGFGQGYALGATPGIGATETHGNTPNPKRGGRSHARPGRPTPAPPPPPLPLRLSPGPALPCEKNAVDLS
jgi:hypothetical protein